MAETPKLQIIEIEGPLNKKSEKKLEQLNHGINTGNHVFLFLFMVGCGPCESTKEPWANIHHHLTDDHKKNPQIIIARVDKDFYPKLHSVGKEPMGFPTLRYISNGGIEEYENAPLKKKDRSAESFAEWIKTKVPRYEKRGGAGEHEMVFRHCNSKTLHTRRRSGGKWSLKYKRSINCRHPKGFSQKQHCKYGRKIKRMKTGTKNRKRTRKYNR